MPPARKRATLRALLNAMTELEQVQLVARILGRCDWDRSTGCIEWQGSRSGNRRGGQYGTLSIKGRALYVHRLMLALHCDTWDEAAHPVARHRCDNWRCVNPDHLEPGTQQDNVDDMMTRGRHARTKQTKLFA